MSRALVHYLSLDATLEDDRRRRARTFVDVHNRPDAEPLPAQPERERGLARLSRALRTLLPRRTRRTRTA